MVEHQEDKDMPKVKVISGATGRNRTADQLITKQPFYP